MEIHAGIAVPGGRSAREMRSGSSSSYRDVPQLPSGRTGRERHPDLAWTPAAYLSHITDDLRILAERLAGARLSGAVSVTAHDPDLMATARCYNEIAPAAALWSLEHAVSAWAESVTAALDDGVALQHTLTGRITSRVTELALAPDGSCWPLGNRTG
jgi:hypothetical protein